MKSERWTYSYLSIFVFLSFLFCAPSQASEKKDMKNDAMTLIGEIGIADKGDRNTNSLYLSFSIPPEDWRERILDFINRWRDDKELRARFSIKGRKIEIWSPKKGDTSLYEKEMKDKGSILIVVGNPGQSAVGTSTEGNGIRGGDGQNIKIRIDNGSIGIAVAQTGGAGSDGKDDFYGSGGNGGNGGMTGGRGGNVGSSSAAEATAFVANAVSMGAATRMPGGGGNADGQIPGARAGNGGDALKAQKARASGGLGKVFDFDGNQSFKSGAFAKGGDSANGGKGGDALPAGHGGNGGNGADGGDAAASNRSEEKGVTGGKLGFGGPAGQPNGSDGLNGQSNGQEEYI